MASDNERRNVLMRDRRRHTRTPVGVPVRVHFEGRTMPMTVEMSDVSLGGCFFRGASAPLSAKLAFGFERGLVAGQETICLAAGKVLRAEAGGFAASIDRANDAFLDFLSELGGGLSGRARAA